MRRVLLVFFVLILVCIQVLASEDYYQSAYGKSGADLRRALYEIIREQVRFPYTNPRPSVWDILKETERDTMNPDNVLLIYTGISVNAAQEWNSGRGWTREHVWPVSRGDLGLQPGAGTDIHHLRAESLSANSTRSNRNFDQCQNCIELLANGIATGSFYDQGMPVFTPREKVMGDVARMILYMDLRYEGELDEPPLSMTEDLPPTQIREPKLGKLSTLLEWHYNDPVCNWEIRRNEIIYQYQRNRNPFIDHPELAEYLWGTKQSAVWNPVAVVSNVPENHLRELTVYPSPARDYVQVRDTPFAKGTYFILRANGQVVLTGAYDSGDPIPVGDLHPDSYIILFSGEQGLLASRFLKL
jgi:endonuclease I